MKKISFKELLGVYVVEIPMLQRDYAQGRASQQKVAQDFLTKIFDVLRGEKSSLHIDFIYGYKENEKFMLIDGQQRITTLWLLHYYLYVKANRLVEISELLKNFSYNTRKSSKKFCENLINIENNPLQKGYNTDEKPSEILKDTGGEIVVAQDMHNDPTIKAMLAMLDLIDETLKSSSIDTNILIENLDHITFNKFDMEGFRLGENLYIKMNARGKQLSKYENLKAFMQKDLNIAKDKDLLTRIDTDWSDYFFDGEDPKTLDERGNNFLHYAALYFNFKNSKEQKVYIKDIKNPNRIVDDFYNPLQKIENIKLLDRTIKLCHSFDKEFKVNQELQLSNAEFFNFDKTLSYSKICYFLSLLSLVDKNDDIESINKDALNDYLRVCRHFIENHRLGDDEDILRFFNLFEHLAQGHSNIYQFLVNKPTYNEKFHLVMYALESKKARLILESRSGGRKWEDILNETSEDEILKGWVDFLLDFSDERFNYEAHNRNKQKLENPNLENFTQYAKLTIQILKEFFAPSKKNEENLAIFQRAFLCSGDYSFAYTNWFYGGKVSNDFDSRYKLHSILMGYKKPPYFKQFLDELVGYENDIKSKMENIIEDFIKTAKISQKGWWEQILIRQKELFKFLNKGSDRRIRYYIGNERVSYNFDSDLAISRAELLHVPSARDRAKIKDLFAYGFYCYCKERKNDNEISIEYLKPTEKNQPHFSIKNNEKEIKIFCGSEKSKIIFDYGDIINERPYSINLAKGDNVFKQFDEILMKENLIVQPNP